MSKSNIQPIVVHNNLFLCMCHGMLFYFSIVCMYAYANVYFKTTIKKQNTKIVLIVGAPLSQALPGYLITAPPSVCVPDVLGVLAVWNQNQIKKKVFLLYMFVAAKTL